MSPNEQEWCGNYTTMRPVGESAPTAPLALWGEQAVMTMMNILCDKMDTPRVQRGVQAVFELRRRSSSLEGSR